MNSSLEIFCVQKQSSFRDKLSFHFKIISYLNIHYHSNFSSKILDFSSTIRYADFLQRNLYFLRKQSYLVLWWRGWMGQWELHLESTSGKLLQGVRVDKPHPLPGTDQLLKFFFSCVWIHWRMKYGFLIMTFWQQALHITMWNICLQREYVRKKIH